MRKASTTTSPPERHRHHAAPQQEGPRHLTPTGEAVDQDCNYCGLPACQPCPACRSRPACRARPACLPARTLHPIDAASTTSSIDHRPTRQASARPLVSMKEQPDHDPTEPRQAGRPAGAVCRDSRTQTSPHRLREAGRQVGRYRSDCISEGSGLHAVTGEGVAAALPARPRSARQRHVVLVSLPGRATYLRARRLVSVLPFSST